MNCLFITIATALLSLIIGTVEGTTFQAKCKSGDDSPDFVAQVNQGHKTYQEAKKDVDNVDQSLVITGQRGLYVYIVKKVTPESIEEARIVKTEYSGNQATGPDVAVSPIQGYAYNLNTRSDPLWNTVTASDLHDFFDEAEGLLEVIHDEQLTGEYTDEFSKAYCVYGDFIQESEDESHNRIKDYYLDAYCVFGN